MRLSRRQYAAHRGVSHTAVVKAIASGRITLEPDGTIDPAAADRQWDDRTDPAKLPERRARDRPHAVEDTEPVTDEATVAAPEPAPEPAPVAGDGSITFQQAKFAHEVVKTRTAKVRLSRIKGDLIDKARAETLFFRLAREERDAWVTWPARVAALMAAELGVETATIQKVLESHVRAHLEKLAQPRIAL